MIVASVVNLNHPDHYFHWSFILISYANLIVIAIMVALFVLALALPFVHARMIRTHQDPGRDRPAGSEGAGAGSKDGSTGDGSVGGILAEPSGLSRDGTPFAQVEGCFRGVGL